MDIKEFAAEFMDGIQTAAEFSDNTFEEELTSGIVDYMIDSGEVISPEICSFKKRGASVSAYDYNDEANSLDLFITVKTDTLVGKISDGTVNDAFSRLMRFYNEVVDDSIFSSIKDPSEEVADIACLIKSAIPTIETLRLFVLTNGLTNPNVAPSAIEEDHKIIEYNVWDMQRVYQQHCFKAGKETVDIDFQINYNTELQCLKMNQENPDIDAYLAIIPGLTLAQIYRKYQQTLLEKNVRTFLQFKGKVNKGIRETLRTQPEMFFSYNNGISTTAANIEIKVIDGAAYITKLENWQIVNGGQTTASIAATSLEKDVDMSKVFVPMKVSVIKNSEKTSELVPSISAYANSQTAIKESDFSSNDPYLINLENFSRSEWVPNGCAKPISKWYFERTRGQYLDQLAQLSGYSEKSFKIEYPKIQRLTKTDIAKVEICWSQRPYEVCKGAEKNYKLFVSEVKKEKPEVTSSYYKRIVAKSILFQYIDKIVKDAKLGGYKSNLNTYLMAALSLKSNKMLDLNFIWESQTLQGELKAYINDLIPLIWDHICHPKSASSAQSTNINEWTKKAECWNQLKLKLNEFDAISDNLFASPEELVDVPLNESQKEKMEQAWAISSDIWFKLSSWAKTYDYLTPVDRKAAYNFGTLRSRNKAFSLKQALYAVKIMDKAKALGFEE